ncbi:MAG: hypothetical protein NXI24_18260 [bacterium]|nr:hypothetical protein [bacterium]
MIDPGIIRQKAARGLRRFRIIEGFRSNEELVEAIYLELKVLLEPAQLYEMERQERECSIETLSVLAAFYKCSIDHLIGHASVSAPV